ncbi:hypothetical protein HZA42_00805 [Candidatus Peregrinibacteria bacterium]|nr:hypothetical protein [Candidatus Peregrinibacteria bacterium]
MKKLFKLAVLSASMVLILTGCGGSSPSPSGGDASGAPKKTIFKNANPSDDVKSAIEDVIGVTKMTGLMQNFPTKGWISFSLSANRKLTANDLENFKRTVAGKGYVFIEGGKSSDEPDDNSLGAAFSGDPYYVMISFEPGKQEIAAVLVPVAEAEKALKEP